MFRKKCSGGDNQMEMPKASLANIVAHATGICAPPKLGITMAR